MQINQLVILAGGKGTRLGAETKVTPKPLVKLFNDFTFLDVLLKRYAHQFDDLLIFSGYKSEMIEEHIRKFYSKPSPNIRVLVESEPAGTAGAFLIHQAELAEQFFVINGDTWFDIDFDRLKLKKKSSVAKLVLAAVSDVSRYGSVILDKYDQIIGFIEKLDCSSSDKGLINTGCYLMSKAILDYIPGCPSSLETEVFPLLVKARLLEGVAVDGSFIDIGIPETLEFARKNKEYFKL